MIIESKILNEFHRLVKTGEINPFEGPLKCGVDLGTANIVLAVVDAQNRPIAGSTFGSRVVRDGIVVDYMGAIRIVKQMKEELEQKLGTSLDYGSCAIPPGILSGNVKVISNVVAGAGFDVTKVVDEPTAAAAVLGIRDGGVVDVGGGTTGISILEDGEVTFVADEPTGGHHMNLVLAGFYQLPYDEAESIKKNKKRHAEVFPVVRPVAQKMASIVHRFIEGKNVSRIFLVGGATSFSDFEDVFEQETGLPCFKANHPLLVTPLGIAMYCDIPGVENPVYRKPEAVEAKVAPAGPDPEEEEYEEEEYEEEYEEEEYEEEEYEEEEYEEYEEEEYEEEEEE